jgi:septal ring factor EnvC (AmiA/AmiB activator)
MLNWRRDPAREMRLKQIESETEQLKHERKQIEKELALLDWMLSEMDSIKAGLPSSSTPPPNTAANSNDC